MLVNANHLQKTDQMPGLNLYTSNRMENLVTILSEIVKEPLNSPFDQEIIVIQNRGMERWLSMQLASRLGIWANSRYPFPSAFVHELFKSVIPEIPERLPSDPELLVWKIMQILPDFLMSDSFKPLSIYLSDSNQVKLFQLSKKIADLFDQYTLYRPEMLFQWEQNKENHWQAELWRAVLPESTIHRAKLKQLFLKKLSVDFFDKSSFPKRISVFGISALPQFYSELFSAISSLIEVNLFVLNPCKEYWDDIFSEKEIARILKKSYRTRRVNSIEKKFHFDQGNSLLSSWGKYGRDFLSKLHECSSEEYSFPVDQVKITLLSRLQSDILNLRERGTSECPSLPIDDNDFSVQIHNCHSPMREVEILYDNILNFFRICPELKPSDIIVMSPDIETYAPYIDAVFGSVQEADLKIPYSLADRCVRVESIVSETFLSLLELPGSRFTVSSIIDLLEVKQIQAAFSIKEEDITVIKNWVLESGIRWGINKQSKEQLKLPAFDENTWSYGLNRLLMGFTLPSEGHLSFGDIAGYDNLEGSQNEILGNFLDLMESLFEFVKHLSQNHDLKEWSDILLQFINRFFKTEQDEEKELIQIRNILFELSSISSELNYIDEIPLDIIKNWITSKLQQQSMRPGFITGSITFCAMLPMRSIPFKIVCIMGLNGDSFPRRTSHFSWDLIAANPKIGDRSLELEDRYLFLESLLSAREILYISYIGQSPHENGFRRPSVIVEELLDYIDKSFYINYLNDASSGDEITGKEWENGKDNISDSNKKSYRTAIKELITKRHHLQAFNQAYFDTKSSLFSFSSENFKASISAGVNALKKEKFFNGPLSYPEESFKSLQINELSVFFQNPSRFLLLYRLGISLQLKTEHISNDEPFDLPGIDHYRISEKLVQNLLKGESIEKCYNQFKITGLLPHGTVGRYHYDILSRNVSEFVTVLKNLRVSPQLDNLFIDNDLDNYHLTGVVENIWNSHLLQFRYAHLKPADLLQIWIRHLILNQFGPINYPKTSVLLSREECFRFNPVENSYEMLHKLLNLYWKGLSFPLPFFPNTSWEYAQQVLVKKKPVEHALFCARKKWEADEFSSIPGDAEDPYNALCFQAFDELGEDFKNISMEIYEPLILHLERVENR